MAFYVRKISRSKWEKGSPSDPDADAITGCTRTTNNTLSLWKIEDNSQSEIEKAILAFSSTMERPDGIEIVVIEDKNVDGIFTVENTIMNIPYSKMNSSHFDITGIKYTTLKSVAELILNAIGNGSFHKITRARILELLKNAIIKGEIKKSDLNNKLQEHL